MPATPTPTDFEQQMLEYLNRARLDPEGEAVRLLGPSGTGATAEIEVAMEYFGVDTEAFRDQVAGLPSVAPLAWNANLGAAAEAHSHLLIEQDAQAHVLPGEDDLGERVSAAGYDWTRLRENVFAYTVDPLHGQAGLFIDWGYDEGDEPGVEWLSNGDGIQDPAGHRNTILSSGEITEVGIGVVEVTDPGLSVGPYAVTQDFGGRRDAVPQLVGVVIEDADGDRFYDMGEGLGGVTVTAQSARGTFSTTTWSSGGYQMELPEGSYKVTFAGPGLTGALHYDIVMGDENLKLDGVVADAAPVPLVPSLPAGTGISVAGSDDADILVGLNGADTLRGGAGDDLLAGDGSAEAAPVSGQVYRLYQATLDRAPDAAGHADWVARLDEGAVELADVAAGFTGSAEFRNTYGTLDSEDFVTLLYNNVLGRDPDAGGLADWTSRLAAGSSRAEVVLGFSESREFRLETAQDAAGFDAANGPAGWSDDVYRIYRATLDRAPDADGFVSWVAKLDDGQTYAEVARGFTDSAEFRNTYGALDDEGFVTLLYANVLNRAPDAGGLAGWTGRLADGTDRTDVVRGFAQSTEFSRTTAAELETFMRSLGQDDLLDGGSGDDALSGGMYADIFVFRPGEGRDRVLDFEAWDTLRFDGFGYDDASDVLANFDTVGGVARFSDQGTRIILEGVEVSQLHEAQIDLI